MHTQAIDGKLMDAREAVRRFVRPGDLLALGGFTVSRAPMALVRQIIRQGIKDLHLATHSQGPALDLLVGAGSLARLELAYGGSERFAPTGVCFRRAVEAGSLAVEDYSNQHMGLRFLAGSLGLPFMPCRSGLASDVLGRQGFDPGLRGQGRVARHKSQVTQNPFSAEEDPVVLLPALNPDVTLLHAQQVGDDGTVRLSGLPFLDGEQARAAGRVVVSCEEIVPAAWLRQEPERNLLPPFLVDAVVLAPWGAHPTACQGFYDYDPSHLALYRRQAASLQGLDEYLEHWVRKPASHQEYLELLGGDTLGRLRANSQLGYAPGLQRGKEEAA